MKDPEMGAPSPEEKKDYSELSDEELTNALVEEKKIIYEIKSGTGSEDHSVRSGWGKKMFEQTDEAINEHESNVDVIIKEIRKRGINFPE